MKGDAEKVGCVKRTMFRAILGHALRLAHPTVACLVALLAPLPARTEQVPNADYYRSDYGERLAGGSVATADDFEPIPSATGGADAPDPAALFA